MSKTIIRTNSNKKIKSLKAVRRQKRRALYDLVKSNRRSRKLSSDSAYDSTNDLVKTKLTESQAEQKHWEARELGSFLHFCRIETF